MSKGKKTGGRQKGTPNKVTSTLRNWLLEVINDNRDLIVDDLQTLDPLQRLVFIEKLLPYVLPKVQTADEVEGACYTKEDVEASGWFDDVNTKKIVKWYESEARPNF